MKDDIIAKKNEIRKQYIKYRKSITKFDADKLSQNFTSIFLKQFYDPSISKFTSIAGYFPINNELNVIPLMEYLISKDIATALPITQNDYSLKFKKWHSGDVLVKNKFLHNLYEPQESQENITPDIILVPIVAFDKLGYRIGYGKGCYDITLTSNNKSTIIIGVAYDFQETDLVPTQKHDKKMDIIITDQRMLIFNATK